MSRPEHVRCENCCYWDKDAISVIGGDPESGAGLCRCHSRGEQRGSYPDDWCGEFRAEWPGSLETTVDPDCPCPRCVALRIAFQESDA